MPARISPTNWWGWVGGWEECSSVRRGSSVRDAVGARDAENHGGAGGDRCARGGRRTAGRPNLSTHLPTIQNIRRIPQNATSSSNVNGTAEAGGGDGGVSLGQPRGGFGSGSLILSSGARSVGPRRGDAPCTPSSPPPPDAARRSRPSTISRRRGPYPVAPRPARRWGPLTSFGAIFPALLTRTNARPARL